MKHKKFEISKQEQLKIYRYLVGDFDLGATYVSPLSEEIRGKPDTNSSFNIFEPKHNSTKIMWKDFGESGTINMHGDAMDLLQLLRDDVKNFGQAIKFYRSRIRNSNHTSHVKMQRITNSRTARQRRLTVEVKTHRIRKGKELLYWRDYGISTRLLHHSRITALDEMKWSDGRTTYGSKEYDPAFVYDLSKDGDMSSWKLYKPLSKNTKFKWMSWNLSSIPAEGYYLLPDTGNVLVISASRKDGLTLTAAMDIPTVNPTCESCWRSMVYNQNDLSDRFDNIFILFDADATGVASTKKLSEVTGWEAIYLDYPKGTKDLADIRRVYGKERLKEIIYNTSIKKAL